jgi:hypothetical protein
MIMNYIKKYLQTFEEYHKPIVTAFLVQIRLFLSIRWLRACIEIAQCGDAMGCRARLSRQCALIRIHCASRLRNIVGKTDLSHRAREDSFKAA